MVKVPPKIAQKATGNSSADLLIPVRILIRFTIGMKRAIVPTPRIKLAANPAAAINSHNILRGFSPPKFNNHRAKRKLMPVLSNPALIIIIAISDITASLEKPENS